MNAPEGKAQSQMSVEGIVRIQLYNSEAFCLLLLLLEKKKNSYHLNEEKRSEIIQFNICIMQSQNDGRDAMKKEKNC